ncbi:MAG: hypothetical protein U9Q08_00575 [Candidatus Omnitrophota bacterium]|nr:hypothetical protein [Candidatus Omnitrophota bacterium]
MKKEFNKNYWLQAVVIAALIIAVNLGFVSAARPRGEIGHTDYVVVLGMKKIAILPFSDRSHQVFSSVLSWKGSSDTVDYIRDCFKNKKIPVVSGRMIEQLLVSEEIIKPFKGQNNPASQEWSVIHSSYSSILTKQILKNITADYQAAAGLSKSRIRKLAKKLKVDAFVRGMILDATPRPFIDTRTIIEKGIPDPFGGILPFRLRSEELAYYGLAGKYEEGLPSLKEFKPATLEFSEEIKKTLEIIIFIQNAETGAVVWSNSFKILHPAVSESFDIELGGKIKTAMDELFSVLYCHKGLWLLVAEKEKDY